MKQLLSLALALLPCLAWAQYPSNGNQKITLGEQTTADGLFFRGVAATDTLIRKPSVDTMAYMLLDTTTNIMWHYKKQTNNAWLRLNLLPSDTAAIAYVNTYGTQTVNGAKTFSSTVTGAKFSVTDSIVTGNGMYLPRTNTLGFSTNGTEKMRLDASGSLLIGKTTSTNSVFKLQVGNGSTDQRISLTSNNPYSFGISRGTGNHYYIGATDETASSLLFSNSAGTERLRITDGGKVWIGYTSDNGAYPLQVNGQIFATNATIATSDIKYKENIAPLNKGLEIVNKLKPVTFNFKNDTENNFSEYEEVGFIAQEVDRALSTETFSKSIVKASDDTDPNSTMGLATQNLIPILVKAIQEQNQLIKQLEQRIINLENK